MSQGARSRPANPVRALRHTAFRWLWLSMTFNTGVHWMDALARGWLVYEMTGSATQLALVHGVRAVPQVIMGLPAGVLADRLERRKLLLFAQIVMTVPHIVLAGLLFSGTFELWHVYATTVVSGVGSALQSPARQSLIPATVPRESLQNAVVLSAGTRTSTQAVGPALAGVLIAASGFALTFGVQALIAMTGLVATWKLRVDVAAQPRSKERVLASVASGLRYAWQKRVVFAVLMLGLVALTLGTPYQHLIPAVTADVLLVGPRETGWLLSATGIGAFAGFVVMALVPTVARPGRVVVVSLVLFSVVVVVFGFSSLYWLSFMAVLVAGVLRGVYRTFTQTMLLAHTDDEYMGRVNSIYVLDKGLVPLGIMLFGLLGDWVGPGVSIAVSGAGCLVVVLLIAVRFPVLWKVRS